MFKAARTQIQATHLPRETRPQRGRRKRSHRRSGRRQQGEVSGDDDPGDPDYPLSMPPSKLPRQEDSERANEEARRRQLREDGRRSLSVNLADGLALSEFLSTFPGSERLSDQEAREAFRAAQKEAAAEG